jgi:hypothetical protein
MFKYTAVIIEPREHRALEFVLHNFFTKLSDEWGFIIFHGRKNKTYVQNILENKLSEYRYRVDKIIELDTDNLTSSQYSKICKSSAFYKCISTEILLIFQTDSIIINPDILSRFLEYDYVGSPWQNGKVGNGGLSLRRKSKMIEVCENVDINFTDHEDNYFCYQTCVLLNMPSFEEAQTFSVETVFHEKSFGIHCIWKYLNDYDLEYLINKYPDIGQLISLNI